MTSTRWWAPSGPHIGPDDEDLGLLRASGSNPRLDLGAALVAAHRVGAAALIDAARTPLVDSRTVIAKLADARSRLGLPMSESVSKSVENRRYAYVLVRDFLDDADMAVHDLFRAAVAKRVPPSVAAQRAAAVYGVDARGLGQYRQLALDPRTHPQAIADAADRVLFSYIEKVAETEADDREEVSKAPAVLERTATSAVTQDDPDTSYWDARTADGQFAPRVGAPSVLARLRERYGIGGQMAPEVDTGRPSERVAQEQEASPTKGKSLTELRRSRARAAQRRRQTQRSQVQTEAPAQARQQTARNQKLRSQTKLTQKQKQQLTGLKPKPAPAPKPPAPKPIRNHPFLEHLGSTENYHELPGTMLMHATEGQAMEFLAKVASSPGRVGRIGYLADYVGDNSVEVSGSTAAGDQLRAYAKDADGIDPTTEYIPADDLNKFDSTHAMKDFLRGKMRDMATRHGEVDFGRLEHIDTYASNDDEGVVVVDETDTILLGSPTVFEFVIEDGQGRSDNETGKHAQWKLDPDQAYKFADPDNWVTTFDYEHGVFVKRVLAVAVDERGVHEYKTGIRKAEAATLTRTQEGLATAPDGTRYYDVRDEQGQFTAAPSIAQRLKTRRIVPAAAQPVRGRSLTEQRRARAQRARAQQRQRQRTSSPAQEQSRTQARSQIARGQVTRAQQHLAQTVREVVATRTGSNVLNDHSDYAVLSEHEAQRYFGLWHGQDRPDQPPVPISPENLDHLLETRLPGDEAAAYIAESVVDPSDFKEEALVDYPHSDEDHAGVQAIVDSYLDRSDVGVVEARPVGDLLSIRVNRQPLKPVVLVEISPEGFDVGSSSSNRSSFEGPGGFDFDNMQLKFASYTTVQHDELLDDGTVRSFAVPVARYIATSSPNHEGRR